MSRCSVRVGNGDGVCGGGGALWRGAGRMVVSSGVDGNR